MKLLQSLLLLTQADNEIEMRHNSDTQKAASVAAAERSAIALSKHCNSLKLKVCNLPILRVREALLQITNRLGRLIGRVCQRLDLLLELIAELFALM